MGPFHGPPLACARDTGQCHSEKKGSKNLLALTAVRVSSISISNFFMTKIALPIHDWRPEKLSSKKSTIGFVSNSLPSRTTQSLAQGSFMMIRIIFLNLFALIRCTGTLVGNDTRQIHHTAWFDIASLNLDAQKFLWKSLLVLRWWLLILAKAVDTSRWTSSLESLNSSPIMVTHTGVVVVAFVTASDIHRTTRPSPRLNNVEGKVYYAFEKGTLARGFCILPNQWCMRKENK